MDGLLVDSGPPNLAPEVRRLVGELAIRQCVTTHHHENDVHCKAMTYINSQRLCWIKNAVPAAASSPDMISAVKQTPQ